MFENIIGHESIVKQIENEIRNKRFPSSSLIEGPLYTGKQTLALEIARSLTCRKKGDWGCGCESCRMHRTLMHPSTLLTGFDNFIPEIKMTSEIMLKKKGETFSRYLFIRSVRKLVKRFDPVFTDTNDSKIKKIIPLLKELEELLYFVYPQEDPDIDELAEKTDNIKEKCIKIIRGINLSGLSVDQIRRITFWVHTSGYKDKKIIIIENCEKMNESARNAFLKVLEEPPEGVYFIFLTGRAGEIIPTIRSRLRKYTLAQRSFKESRDVIEKIFREKPGIEFTLKDFINSWTSEHHAIEQLAKDFIITTMDTEKSYLHINNDIKKILKSSDANLLKTFFESVLNYMSLILANNDFMRSSPDSYIRIKKISNLVNSGFRNKEILNINPELLVENIFIRMRNNI